MMSTDHEFDYNFRFNLSTQSEELPMKKILWLAGLFAFLAIAFSVQQARAHESVMVGDYEIVTGWVTEPPLVGQMNGIELHVSNTSTGQPVEDITSLIVTISYGGQDKTLSFKPLGEDNPGGFEAPILPTVAGEYELHFGGTLGDTAADTETHVEEVQLAETLAFPRVDSAPSESGSSNSTVWLAIAGLLSGLAGLILSLVNMRKRG
jgi:hypothetical protein